MTDEEIDTWLNKWEASDLSIESFLALANANGLSFPKTLELHRWILAAKGRAYVATWGSTDGGDKYPILRDGGYYVLSHIQYAEWENAHLA